MSVVKWPTTSRGEDEVESRYADRPVRPAVAAPEGDARTSIAVRDVCRVTRQLSTLLRAGMPLASALSAMVEQSRQGWLTPLQPQPGPTGFGWRGRQGELARIMEQIHRRVNEGGSLAEALHEHPDAFSDLFVNMVAAGEASGNLEEILVRLAQMMERRLHLTAKIKAALAYPVVMTLVAVAVVTFLLSVVIPSIAGIFLQMNHALPWPTRFLIAVSGFLRSYGIALAVGLCLAGLGLAAVLSTSQGRSFTDRMKLRLPFLGGLLLKVELARLTRTLGMLLASGMPILKALEIARSVTTNSRIAQALEQAGDAVAHGQGLAEAIRATGLFPPVVFHVLATGQLSGDLEQGLTETADMYDDEIELTIRALVSVLEPAILLVMGAVVGFIVLAILLPIFEINQAL